ncbi:MAG: prephenate dehydrogenase [Candidatus Omnitrophota bacterium]|jgi:prephenate dehydrogenase
MTKRSNVLVVGAGLLGASILLALRKSGSVGSAAAICRDKKSITKLKECQPKIRSLAMPASAAFKAADIIILAMPVKQIEDFLLNAPDGISPNCLIMDVGSTKESILKAVRKSSLKKQFIGCHPMAGGTGRGPAYAKFDLFTGADCFIVNDMSKKLQLKAIKFWRDLGCSTISLSAKRHDAIVAAVSHAPHLLSTALFLALDKPKNAKLKYEGPGLKSMLRLSGSNAVIWSSIYQSNGQRISAELDLIVNSIKNIKKMIDDKNWKKLGNTLDRVSKIRQKVNYDE